MVTVLAAVEENDRLTGNCLCRCSSECCKAANTRKRPEAMETVMLVGVRMEPWETLAASNTLTKQCAFAVVVGAKEHE